MTNTYQYSAHVAGRICEECFEHFSNIDVAISNAKCTTSMNLSRPIIEEGKVKVDIGKPVRRLAFDRSQITYA